MSRLILLLLLLPFLVQSQIYDPVKWETKSEQLSENEFNLIFTANIESGWSIYSQFQDGEDGPIPTSINFDEGTHFQLIGKAKELSEHKKSGFDKMFKMNLTKFMDKVSLVQKIKVNDPTKPITGYVTFMTCDNTKCLPPADVDFDIKVVAKTVSPKIGKKKEEIKKKTVESIKVPSPKEKITTSIDQVKSARKPEFKSQISVAPAKDEAKAPEHKKNGISDPVDWQFNLAKKDNKDYLVFKAILKKGWNLYSQHTEENGPIPTSFNFTPGDHFKLIGKMTEKGHLKEENDPIFGVNVTKFVDGTVLFSQQLDFIDPSKPVHGYINYMSCDNRSCLNKELDYVAFPASGKVLLGDSASDWFKQNEQKEEGVSNPALATAQENSPYPTAFTASIDVNNPAEECGKKQEKTGSLLKIFLLGILGGLVALLTPCVFPMIPLTVSFFTKGAKNKKKGKFNAIMYGFFILLVYLIMSAPFHVMDSLDPDILNGISTNVWLNVGFFVIFIFFAFSFFGYYEITLPESWQNKSASAETSTGMLGIFFMALTLALVSFSCTGPILGSLLAGALTSDGGAWQLTAGMAGFGVSLALPFALFAMFPAWLNALPSSGGWLTTVKVVLGFVELAMAFKFLSNADLVEHWGLLKIEPFLIIWMVIFLGLAVYLFGKIKFPHDSPVVKLSPMRKLLGVISLALVIYLASGFRYNEETSSWTSLSLLSGLAPPVGYSIMYPRDCPQNFNCFKDLEEGLAYAQKVNKPILLDFTGYACVNCRKMEEHVWPNKDVFKQINEEFILISLYVDDKKVLDQDKQVIVQKKQGGSRKLRKKGDVWSHFQTEYFETNAQPWYVLITPNGKVLNNPRGYTTSSSEYAEWLKCGSDAYKRMQKE